MTAAVLKKEKQPSEKQPSAVKKEHGSHAGRHTGLMALYHKELADHLRSKRFLIILLLILGTSIASLYGALNGETFSVSVTSLLSPSSVTASSVTLYSPSAVPSGTVRLKVASPSDTSPED